MHCFAETIQFRSKGNDPDFLLIQEQGMVGSINAAELSWYEVEILDACCWNIPAVDELWRRVVEVSVLLLMFT